MALPRNRVREYLKTICLHPVPSGTGGSEVEVTIGPRPASRIGAAVSFAFMGYVTLSSSASALSSSSPDALIGPLVGIAFGGFGLLLLAFLRWLARGDPEFLISYVNDRLSITDSELLR